MTREDTPDLLESLFAPAPKTVKKPAKKPSTRKKPATKQATVQKSQPEPPVEPLEPPIRCTHYMSRATSSRMHNAQGQLLILTLLKKRDVSNSNLVEASLRMAFDDLEAKGEKSHLVKILHELAQQQKSTKA